MEVVIRPTKRTERAAKKLQRITADLEALCKEMDWKGFTLRFENGLDKRLYEARFDPYFHFQRDS